MKTKCSMKPYDVTLYGEKIDTVFHAAYGKNKEEREQDVKSSLVNHDNYNDDIKVKEVRR